MVRVDFWDAIFFRNGFRQVRSVLSNGDDPAVWNLRIVGQVRHLAHETGSEKSDLCGHCCCSFRVDEEG